MAGYPPPGFGYQSYAAPPYGAFSSPSNYAAPQQPSAPYAAGGYGYQPPYGSFSPFVSPAPSIFPPGTDPTVIACFRAVDRDGSGFIDDRELQMALSSVHQSFSMRTVHLLMHLYATGSGERRVGQKDFVALFYSLHNWRATFERFDRDRSGRIDASELREALRSFGFTVSDPILDLLICKFDRTGGRARAVEYDSFIECCLTVKGLTEKFKERDSAYMGSATFTYEAFMLAVLPFLVA